jgi:hypothetical protein
LRRVALYPPRSNGLVAAVGIDAAQGQVIVIKGEKRKGMCGRKGEKGIGNYSLSLDRMSNRNFDASVVTGRIRDKNVAQQIYGAMRNGRAIGNPQTVNANASVLPEYNEGVETIVEKGLRARYTFDLGGIANYVALDQGGGGGGATVPGAPTLDLITPGDQTLTIAFTAPTDGGSPLLEYEYTYTDLSIIGPTPVVITVAADIFPNPFIITGLTNGNGYEITLRARNSVGWGPIASGTGVPATVPDAPTINSITPGNAQLIVNFAAPGFDGGSSITGYQYSTGSIWVTPSIITSNQLTITGLTNGTTYNVKIRAVNVNGPSAQSNTVPGTPVAPITPPTPPPTIISGVGGNQAIYILFTAGGTGGSPITNYKYSTDGGATYAAFTLAQTISPLLITATSDTTLPLVNGTPYTVLIKATNVIGDSAASNPTSIIPVINTLNTTSRLINLDASNPASYPGSGTSWTNLDSGGSYSATLLPTPPIYNPAGYLTFDGISQIAQIAQNPAINPVVGGAYTLQIWAQVDTASPNFTSGDGLISKQFGSPSYDGYSLSLNQATNAIILNMNGNTVNGNYSSSAGAFNNQWALYTIVVRFGGGAGAPSYVYVSTYRVVSASNAEGFIPPTAPLQFPRGIQDTGANYCPANVGAFYFYNRTLSQEEIIQNYDATKFQYGL